MSVDDANQPIALDAPVPSTKVDASIRRLPKLVTVAASALLWHPGLGLEHKDFERAYAAAAQPELDRLSAGLPALYCPLCVAINDRYGVIGEIPTALAVMTFAVEHPRAKIGIALAVDDASTAATTSLFDVKHPRRPWEQAQYVRQNIGDRSVRDYLKQRYLPKRFETSISKAKKLLTLDPAITEVIAPMTITSIAQAGRVVNAWADPQSHDAMAAALALQKRDSNQHGLDARPVFAAMLKAADLATTVPKAAATWKSSKTGFEAVLASGKRVTLTSCDSGWLMECIITSAGDLKAIGALPPPTAAVFDVDHRCR